MITCGLALMIFQCILNFYVHSNELIFDVDQLIEDGIHMKTSKFADLKKVGYSKFQGLLQALILVIGHCQARKDYKILKHCSIRFERCCILSTNYHESVCILLVPTETAFTPEQFHKE